MKQPGHASVVISVQLATPEPCPEASCGLLRQLEELPCVAVLQVVPPHPSCLGTLARPAQLTSVLQVNMPSNSRAQGSHAVFKTAVVVRILAWCRSQHV